MKHAVSALFVVLVWSFAAGPPASAASQPIPELLASLPEDTLHVLAVQLSDLQRSAVYERFERDLMVREEQMRLRDFADKTGLDLERDLERAVCALIGPMKEPGFACLVAGRFSVEQLTPVISQRVGARELDTVHGTTLWQLATFDSSAPGAAQNQSDAPDAGAHIDATLAVPEDGLAVFGNAAGVRAVLAVRSGKAASIEGGQLWDLIGNSRGEIAGAVNLTQTSHGIDRAVRGPLPAALQTVETLAFDARFGRHIELDMVATSRNEEDAELLRQAVLGAIAAGKLSSKQEPELAAFLAEFQVSRAGKEVAVSSIVSESMLDRLHEQWQTIEREIEARRDD